MQQILGGDEGSDNMSEQQIWRESSSLRGAAGTATRLARSFHPLLVAPVLENKVKCGFETNCQKN